MPIERDFDIEFIGGLALREKQIQQNYRPIIAVHKWFARRPGTLFRGLMLSEFGLGNLRDIYFEKNSFPGVSIADPFMGGGTPLLEANRLGCDVVGFDVNPMANWVVREEIEHLSIDDYVESAKILVRDLKNRIGNLYKTRCSKTGAIVDVKYFLWVKQGTCKGCHGEFDLFQGYLISKNVRHPNNVVVCSCCGEINEVSDLTRLGNCNSCNRELRLKGNVDRNTAACPHCSTRNKLPFREDGPPQHRMFAIEYHRARETGEVGRLFKKPDVYDLMNVDEAENRLSEINPKYVPDDVIAAGDETDRLRRWGYNKWREMFNARQLLSLETSAQLVRSCNDERIQKALATNLSDLLRYQNMACRYDTMALKSLDIFSVHGFPIGYVQCESNILGISGPKGAPVGSGGWANIIEKYRRAKTYCDTPFEIRFEKGRKTIVEVKGEWIGERREGSLPRKVELFCASATEVELPAESLDAVFTDPPYFGMVQYGELMEFCYVWLRKLMGPTFPGMEQKSARHRLELTGNQTANRDITSFAEGLSESYRRAAISLKKGAPLAFTYHHNRLEAYAAVAVAVLDAGLNCSASIPCPAEMGGSIHINGTGSSIVDTVFVCRSTGSVRRSMLFASNERLAEIVSSELRALSAGGMKPSDGDVRCIVYGHITRMAIWRLRRSWRTDMGTREKLALVREEMDDIGQLEVVRSKLNSQRYGAPATAQVVREDRVDFDDEIAF